MTKVTIEGMDELLKNMDNLQKKIETGAAKGVNDCVSHLSRDIRENYLRGQALKMQTGNLSSNITDHSATAGEIAEGAVSSTAVSPDGFDYDVYHEYNDFVRNYSRYSSATGSHRAFMKPSFIKNSDKMQEIVKDFVKRGL